MMVAEPPMERVVRLACCFASQEGDSEEIAKCPRNCHGEPICVRHLSELKHIA